MGHAVYTPVEILSTAAWIGYTCNANRSRASLKRTLCIQLSCIEFCSRIVITWAISYSIGLHRACDVPVVSCSCMALSLSRSLSLSLSTLSLSLVFEAYAVHSCSRDWIELVVNTLRIAKWSQFSSAQFNPGDVNGPTVVSAIKTKLGCSRTTVAVWGVRVSEGGRLPEKNFVGNIFKYAVFDICEFVISTDRHISR